MTDRLVYRPNGKGVSFEWEGGAYIDIFSMTDDSPNPNATEGAFQRASAGDAPFANIGVRDYGNGKSSIPFSREAFELECDAWLDDNAQDYGL